MAAVPPRVSIITLGARDLPALRDFYESLGWVCHRVENEFARFETGGAVLTLYGREDLARDVGLEPGAGFGNVTLALNVEERDMVDQVLAAAREAGGKVTSDAVDREWGGRSGYFTDPEGNVWEVAWMPGGSFDERGAFVWPERD